MKVISRLAALAVLPIAIAAALPAGATCNLPSQFASNQYWPSPGSNFAARVRGAWWALGQGNPASPGGADNGGWGPQDPSIPGGNLWLRNGGPGVYVGGDWALDTRINGCIHDPPNPQPGMMVIALTDSDGGAPGPNPKGYFAVACVQENAHANFEFGAANGGADLAMVPIPKPSITGSSRGPAGTVDVRFAAPTIEAGVYTDGLCPATGLVRGYKLYAVVKPRNEREPISRLRTGPEGWIAASLAERPLGSTESLTLPCSGESAIWVATSLVFDSGFEGAHLSQNSTKVECSPNLTTKPNQFRLIKNPKGVRNP